MKKSEEVKEKIIEVTISLIHESAGDVAEINTRAIAEKAHVGIGLINYHFQTKENLIEICVERMIGKVISVFAPSAPELTPTARLKHSVKLVFDFFIANPAVTRISILSDCKNPKQDDNTMKSVMGICKGSDDFKIPENKRFIFAFTLVSVMQAMFLRKDQSNEYFGYDLNIKKQRDEVLDLLIDNIFGRSGDEK